MQPRARPGQRKPPIQQAHKGAAYLQGVDDSVQKRLRKVRPKDQSNLVLRKPPQVPPIHSKQYQSAATIASEDYSHSAQADGEDEDPRRETNHSVSGAAPTTTSLTNELPRDAPMGVSQRRRPTLENGGRASKGVGNSPVNRVQDGGRYSQQLRSGSQAAKKRPQKNYSQLSKQDGSEESAPYYSL